MQSNYPTIDMQRMKKETPHNFTEHVFKKNWSMWWDGMWWDGILSALLTGYW